MPDEEEPAGFDAALVALCEHQLTDEVDPERRARLRFEVGQARLTSCDYAAAAAAFEAALVDAPDHLAALHGLRRARQAQQQWEAVVGLIDRELALTAEPARRGHLLRRKAELLDEHLGDPTGAMDAYQEALAAEPSHLGALKGLERLQTRAGAWAALADTYAELALRVRDPRLRAAWLARQAHLTETRLGDPDRALQLYEAAAQTEPTATTALVHLKRLAASRGDLGRLAGALRGQLALAADPRDRQELHLALTAALERGGDLDGAVEACLAALAEAPSDRRILERLASLHAAQSDWTQQAEVLARLVALATTPTEAARLAYRVAALHLHRLGDSETGRQWLARAFDADPRLESAAQELCSQLEAAGDWSALLLVLARRAEVTPAPGAQAELHHRMGVLLEERLGRPDEAARRYAHVLGVMPAHPQAFAALCRLHVVAGRWRDLAELYQRAADRAPHTEEASAWLTRLGNVLEDRLDDTVGALHAYERVVELEPRSLGALHAVQRAAERAGRYERLVQALRSEAGLTADPVRRDSLLHRAAVLEIDHLGDIAGGRRALQAILARTPDHTPTLETLAEVETAAGRWDSLREILQRQLAMATEPRARARLRLRIGELEETQLRRPEAAVASYRQALADDPELRPARRALWRVLETTEAWAALVAELDEAIVHADAPDERAALSVRQGELYERRLGDPAAALAAYERAVAADPLHRVALDARYRLLVEASDWAGLSRALANEAKASADAHLRAQATLENTFVKVRHGADQEARDAAAALLRASPDSIGAVLAAEEVGLRLSDSSALRAALARLAGASTDPAAVLAALEELLRVRRKRGEPLAPVLERIVRLCPDDADSLEQLADDLSQAGENEAELAAREQIAELVRDPGLTAADQSRLGYLRLRRGDPQQALTAFRAALASDGRNLGARRGFTLAARAVADPNAMREAARGERDVIRDRKAAVSLWLDAAELAMAAGQESDAAACYAEALETAPDSPEAAMGLMATMMYLDGVPLLVDRLQHASRIARDPSRAAALHRCVAQLHAEVLHDLPAAIASVRQAVARCPQHPAAGRQLASYLERSKQWSAAVETLESLLPRLTTDERVKVLLRMASIREQELLELDRAAEDLHTVLRLAGEEPAALSALARVERLRGNDAQARQLVRRLLEIVTDERDRATALAELAQLERDRGALEAAAAAALEATSMDGPSGPAAQVYRELMELELPTATPVGYQQALIRFLERPVMARKERALAYRELARISERTQGGLDNAVATLQRGAVELPEDSSIALSLVAAFRRAGRDAEALEEARRLLTVDPREPAVWRAVAEILSARGDRRGASSALAPLLALRQATEEEQRIVASRPAQVAALPPDALSVSTLRRLFGPRTFEDPWASFLPAAAELVAKLEGVDYASWGVSKRDRLRPGDAHPLRELADRIAAIFGNPEFDLFVLPGERYRHGFVLTGSPPAVMIPDVLAQAHSGALAFEMARPIALVARQAHPLDHIEDEKLERTLVGLAVHFAPSFTVRARLEQHELDALEAEAHRVGKAIGFFARGRLQEAVQRFTAEAVGPFAPWARAVRLEASKAALLVADELLAVVGSLGEAIGPENEATELARFWVSEPALRLWRVVAAETTADT